MRQSCVPVGYDSNDTSTWWDQATYPTISWPTLITVDFYHAVSRLDFETHCIVRKDPEEHASRRSSSSFTSSAVFDVHFPIKETRNTARAGFISFPDAAIVATSRAEPFRLLLSCELPHHQIWRATQMIFVRPCEPGFALDHGYDRTCLAIYVLVIQCAKLLLFQFSV